MSADKFWRSYMPSEDVPFIVCVPENDDHPIPHTIDSMECHCQPQILTHDPDGTEYKTPIVMHSAFDGRELIEQAEEIWRNGGVAG